MTVTIDLQLEPIALERPRMLDVRQTHKNNSILAEYRILRPVRGLLASPYRIHAEEFRASAVAAACRLVRTRWMDGATWGGDECSGRWGDSGWRGRGRGAWATKNAIAPWQRVKPLRDGRARHTEPSSPRSGTGATFVGQTFRNVSGSFSPERTQLTYDFA